MTNKNLERILLLATSVSFLFVFVAGEKLTVPIWAMLFYGLVQENTLLLKFGDVLLIIATFFLPFSFLVRKPFRYVLTTLAIAMMDVFVVYILNASSLHMNNLAVTSNCIYAAISTTALCVTVVSWYKHSRR